MHRITWIVCLFFCMTAVSASTGMRCPTPGQVRGLSISGWQVLDDDTDQVLSSGEIERMTSQARRFALAVWGKSKDGHCDVSCFYQDAKNQQLGFRLRKIDVTPVRSKQRWYEAGLQAKDLHCSASEERCQFA